MTNDRIRFNEKLKFSWGHIVAAVALVAIAYCTFVGMVYLLKGKFLLSGLITAAITLLLALLFFIPQQLKATDRRFEKRIKWERAFIFSSPILFLLLMVPFSHAWTVHHRQSRILDAFEQVVATANGMFDSYETYCQTRETNFRHALRVYNNEEISVANANKLDVLHLALLSSNYERLKNESKAWMDKSSNGKVSTWNVFLLGNITEIQEAVHSWYEDLQTFSETKLSEEKDVKIFDNTSLYINEIDNRIQDAAVLYSDIKGFGPLTLLWLLIGYAMLLFPYLLQRRNTKTTGTNWTLFGFRNNKSSERNENDSVLNEKPDSSTPPTNNKEKYQSFQM